MRTRLRLTGIFRLLILLASSLEVLTAQRPSEQERATDEARCNAEQATDRAEPDAAKGYSSPRLLRAKRTWGTLWAFLNSANTPYPERLAAAYQGSDLVTADAFPKIWTALADSMTADDIEVSACERLYSSAYRSIVRTPNAPEYPASPEARARAPSTWQIHRALRVLLGQAAASLRRDPKRYDAMSAVAWKWSPVNYQQAYERWQSMLAGPRNISLIRNIVRLALSDEYIYAASDNLYVGCDDTYHYEELTHAAQVLILTRTKKPEVARLAAYWMGRLAGDRDAGCASIGPMRSSMGALAVARWASDTSLDAWERYYSYVGPLMKMVDDPPLMFDPQLDPQSPKVSAELGELCHLVQNGDEPLTADCCRGARPF